MVSKKIKVAIFASGKGTNAQKIIDYFRINPDISISLIVCNKSNAGVLSIASKENIPSLIIGKDFSEFNVGYVDFIVLAGFLWKIPNNIIKYFPNKIINIHPSLLPKYGGIGMYGNFVHKAVIDNNEIESGITIHYVNNEYDKGDIIYQKRCLIDKNDTIKSLSTKIQNLEHIYYPIIIEKIINLSR